MIKPYRTVTLEVSETLLERIEERAKKAGCALDPLWTPQRLIYYALIHWVVGGIESSPNPPLRLYGVPVTEDKGHEEETES